MSSRRVRAKLLAQRMEAQAAKKKPARKRAKKVAEEIDLEPKKVKE